ncbi:hypothetical protein [Streptomyces sp. NPDC054804]
MTILVGVPPVSRTSRQLSVPAELSDGHEHLSAGIAVPGVARDGSAKTPEELCRSPS